MDAAQPASGLISQAMADASVDLVSNYGRRLSPVEKGAVLREGRRRLEARQKKDQLSTYPQLRAAWIQVVRECHTERNWHLNTEDLPTAQEDPHQGAKTGNSFVRALFLSMVPMKAALIYFGAYYSTYPGQGWGYWFVGTIMLSCSSLCYLIWRYRKADL